MDVDIKAPNPVAREAVQKLQRVILRRAIKAGAQYMLKPSRLTLEALSNVIPGVDVIGDAMAVRDAMQTAAEVAELTTETKAALDFIGRGQQTVDALKMKGAPHEVFESFGAFKKTDDLVELYKRFGRPLPGWEYHHIVEQGAANVTAAQVNSTDNIVMIPKFLHEEITAEFASRSEASGPTLRQSLKNKSFHEQYEAGVDVMRKLGIVR